MIATMSSTFFMFRCIFFLMHARGSYGDPDRISVSIYPIIAAQAALRLPIGENNSDKYITLCRQLQILLTIGSKK
jgi:hypothetical protein